MTAVVSTRLSVASYCADSILEEVTV